MNCQKCNSERIANVGGKCSDCCAYSIGNIERHGYVPDDLGIGGGDYIDISYCLDCGQLQGSWPLPEADMEETEEE